MSDDDEQYQDEGFLDATPHMQDARGKLIGAKQALTIARDILDREDPKARDLSIAITHIEDALLRIER